MAPRKPSRLVDNPPSASPSLDHEQESEEEVDESQEEESEEEEEQQQQKTPKKSHKKWEKNPQKTKPSSPSYEEEEEHQEEEEEDGSDGDEDSDDNTKSSPTASDFTIKPSVPTHANTSKNQQHQQAKPTSKRALEVQKNDEKKDSSRKKSKLSQENGEEAKRVVANSGGGGGGSNFGRVWSEDDEIAVLKGMIDYQNQKGSDPHADMGAFHEFVKGRFGFDVTKTQLYEKVRRLKKKFFNNLEKVGEDGQDPVFSKPHDFNSFELSKKVWGANNANGGGVSNAVDENVKASEGKAKKSGKIKSFEGKPKEDDKKKREEEKKEDNEKMIVEKEVVKDVVKGEEGDFSEKYPYLSASFDVEILPMSESERKFLKGNISLIDSEKARELEENWKRLRMEEIEFFYRRSKLMIEQTGLVMDVSKKR